MEKRHPLFPDVPTFRFAKINRDPAFQTKMREGGYVTANVGYDDMPAFMANLGKKYREVWRLLGPRP